MTFLSIRLEFGVNHLQDSDFGLSLLNKNGISSLWTWILYGLAQIFSFFITRYIFFAKTAKKDNFSLIPPVSDHKNAQIKKINGINRHFLGD